MHVAVDAHDLVRDRRGIGRYLRSVLARLLPTPGVRFTLLVREPLPLLHRRAFARALGVPSGNVRMARRVPRDADVVWHPWNGTFDPGSRNAATVHDVAPFAVPDPDPARRERQQAPFRRTAATADRIIADSAFTRGEVTRLLGVPPERIAVVPLGVDPAFCPGPLDALPEALRGRRYVLHVGAQDRHKNVATLAAAHARAFPAGDVRLVVTRPLADGSATVVADASQDVLVALYRGAALVAVPSLYEGFGLPVLEAMACGAPVLAARAASLPEVGGDAIRYVDAPASPTAWARALASAIDDAAGSAALRETALARAATFTWERCAAATLAELRAAAG